MRTRHIAMNRGKIGAGAQDQALDIGSSEFNSKQPVSLVEVGPKGLKQRKPVNRWTIFAIIAAETRVLWEVLDGERMR